MKMEAAGSNQTVVNIYIRNPNLSSGSFNDTFNSSGYILLNGKDYW
jgi:hypothetical protein